MLRKLYPLLCLLLARPLAAAGMPPTPPPARDQTLPAVPSGIGNVPASMAIRGVTLIDGNGGPPVRNACVVTANGRIAAAGPLGRVSIPAGARVVAVPKGITLLPGLVDMHVHSTVQSGLLPYFLACGITSVRDLGCAESRLEALKRYRAAAAADREAGPRMFLAGPPLDGFPRAATWFPGPGARDAAAATAAVDQLADAGVDLIKLYRRLNPAAAKAAVEEAHRRGLPVTWDYQWNYRYLFNALQTGTDGLEHVYYSERASQDEYHQLAELIAQTGTWFEPTLVAFRPPDVTVTEDPDFRQLPTSLTRFWNGLFWPMETDQEFSRMKSFVMMVHHAGGRLLAGTDSPVKYSAPGYALYHELRLLEECHLSRMEVLQAATRSAARSLRREHELGTVEAGKLADLLLVQGDPLQDLGVLRKVYRVVRGGHLFDPVALVRQARAAAPIVDIKLPPHTHGD